MAARPTLSFETAAPPARLFHVRCDLPGALLRTAVLVGLATALITLTLAFRLGVQFVAWSPPTPASWLYSLGGALASPFSRYETARPVQPGTGIEFAGLVALEAYLTAGLALLLGLVLLRRLARRCFAAAQTFRLDYGAALAASSGIRTLAGEAFRYCGRVLTRERSVAEVEDAVRPLLSFETPPAPPAASQGRAGRRARPAAPNTRA
jgi:hypothetical protein